MGVAKTKAQARFDWWSESIYKSRRQRNPALRAKDNISSEQKELKTSRPTTTRAFQELSLYRLLRIWREPVPSRGRCLYSGYPTLHHFGSHVTGWLIKWDDSFAKLLFLKESLLTKAHNLLRRRFNHSLNAKKLSTTSSLHYSASNDRAVVKNIKKILCDNICSHNTVRDGIFEAVMIFKNAPIYGGPVPSVMVFGRSIRDFLLTHRKNFDTACQRSVEGIEPREERVIK